MLQTNNAGAAASYVGVGVAAAVAAAGAAYFLDPRSGGRRRALLRDQLQHAAHVSKDFAGKASRDAQQRARGMYERSRRVFHEEQVDDHVLEERVRAALGRLTTHPGAIEVACSDGAVHLRGDILEQEVSAVVHGVERVHGVREVSNEMLTHREPGRIPALQGTGAVRTSRRFEYMQENWSPAPRLLAGAAGVGMIIGGAMRGAPLGLAFAAGGAALLARSICNTPLTQLVGVSAGEKEGVLVQKTIEVYCEPGEAYRQWRRLEELPRFMNHVREVRKIDEGCYHWVVDGPAGAPIEWDATITADKPDELIAWRTEPHSAIHSSGVVRFEPTAYGGARVHVRMTYRPPANAIGRTVARIFGRDPGRQIGEDLIRFKQYMESGSWRLTQQAHSAAVSEGVSGELRA